MYRKAIRHLNHQLPRGGPEKPPFSSSSPTLRGGQEEFQWLVNNTSPEEHHRLLQAAAERRANALKCPRCQTCVYQEHAKYVNVNGQRLVHCKHCGEEFPPTTA
jgi:hypothetical protein